MKRPLLAVALLEVCGILLAPLPVPLVALFTLGLLLVALFALLPRARLPLLCGLIVLVGWTNLASRKAVLSPYDLRKLFGKQDTGVTVRGVLVETPRRTLHQDSATGAPYWTSTATITVNEVRPDGQDWQPGFGKIATTTTDRLPEDFFGGQSVEVAGALEPARGPVAEGLFDYRAYLEQQGIYHEMRLKQTGDWRIVNQGASPPVADRFQAWAKNALARGLPEEDEALQLEWALTLGWKAALTDQVSESFIQSATYHIFAVDGLRIAIVAGILMGLFRAMTLPRAWCGLMTVPFILFYAAMTGWPASAVRAIVMATVIFGGWALKRPSDLINSLLAAAIIILTWEPRELFQAGFQLSFLVVLCIILILPFFEKLGEWLLRPDPLLPEHLRPRWQRWLHPPARGVMGLFLASVAAWLGSIPLVAYYFHLVTPVSGPANVLAVPLCALVLICNLSSLLLVTWLPWFAVLFNHAGWFLMKGIIASSQWSAHWPGAFWYVPMPGLFTIALYYGVLLAVFTRWLFRNPARKWKLGATVLLVAIWCAQWAWSLPVTRLTVVPLNGGHAVYTQSPGSGQKLLIDTGDRNRADAVVKPFLRAQGVNRLSRLMLTHGESDFTGGAGEIADLFRPAEIATSAVRFRSQGYREFEASLRTNTISQTTLHPGDHAGPFTILYPGPDDHLTRAEDETLVFRADINGTRVLLLSDLGHAGQNDLLNDAFLAGKTNDLRADIVVSGLPAENEPLSDALLDAVQPKLIVIADSERPAPRKAGAKLKERLARRNVPVIYESESDSVTLVIRPGHWKARAMDGTKVRGD